MEPNFETKRPSKAKTIWLVIVIFLFGLSNTAWGLFYYKQNQDNGSLSSKSNNLSKSNDQLSSKVKKLNSEISTLNEKIAKNTEEDASNTWRVIPEMNIKYKLDADTADLTYTYLGGATPSPYITWTSKSLTDKSTLAEACDSYSAPIIRWETVKDAASTGMGEKKVGEKTIYAIAPQAYSERSATCKDQALTAKFQAAVKKALESLQPVSNN